MLTDTGAHASPPEELPAVPSTYHLLTDADTGAHVSPPQELPAVPSNYGLHWIYWAMSHALASISGQTAPAAASNTQWGGWTGSFGLARATCVVLALGAAVRTIQLAVPIMPDGATLRERVLHGAPAFGGPLMMFTLPHLGRETTAAQAGPIAVCLTTVLAGTWLTQRLLMT